MEYDNIKIQAIPVGLESKVFDPELIKSKIEKDKKSTDKIIMILLNPFD